jgi:hypothetical protein
MKITLKNIKYSAFASEETNCFSATIYIDGKKACEVRNGGYGGPNEYGDHEVIQQINKYAKTLPKLVCDFTDSDGKPVELEMDADLIIDRIVEAHLERKETMRLCKGRTVFRAPNRDYKQGEYSTIKMSFSPESKKYVTDKYGDTTFFLNETI